MKAILIIDIPEKYKFSDFQEVITDLWFKGKKSFIRNYSYMHRGVELRPLPTKKVPLFDPNNCDEDKEYKIICEIEGYNRCIDELLGETE